MKNRFYYFTTLVLIFSSSLGYLKAQEISIDDCQQLARANYPAIKQLDLIEKSTAFQLSNISKAWLPQLSLNAKATYQSDAIKIDIPPAGIKLNQSKDQYNAALDVSQTIWDGGATKAQKSLTKAQAETEKQKVELDLYALTDRVNQLFFGILLINEQLQQIRILKADLETNIRKVHALEANGIAYASDVDMLMVEQINANQRETDLLLTQKSFIEMLSAFTKKELNQQTIYQKPLLPQVKTDSINNRPELLLLNQQYKLYESQRELVKTSTRPKLGLFAQGGYGRPGLNMLANDFMPYYIGGVRLSWNISSFYTRKNELEKITVQQNSVNTQRETFIFNTSLQNKQQLNEIDKLKSAMANDDKIIALRTRIKTATSARVDNGTATVTDLIRDLNAENNAKQMRSLHEIQLYSAIYQLKYQTNN